MPRLTTPYIGAMPVLRLAIKGPGGRKAIAGVVDSGADKTLLPNSVASALGVPDEDLQPTPEGSGGAGNIWFPTWVLPYPLEAQVIVPFAPPRGIELWGPALQLSPEFAKDTVALFGRVDFFETFTVTFDQPGGQVFHLDYPD